MARTQMAKWYRGDNSQDSLRLEGLICGSPLSILPFPILTITVSRWRGGGPLHVRSGDGPKERHVTMDPHRPHSCPWCLMDWCINMHVHGCDHNMIAHAGPRQGSLIRKIRRVGPTYHDMAHTLAFGGLPVFLKPPRAAGSRLLPRMGAHAQHRELMGPYFASSTACIVR